jgi:hypothetical protein
MRRHGLVRLARVLERLRFDGAPPVEGEVPKTPAELARAREWRRRCKLNDQVLELERKRER